MLAMQYTGDGEAERGMNPPITVTAEYAARRQRHRRRHAVAILL